MRLHDTLSPVEVTREITLDAAADDVWSLLSDPDELAGWVGDEIRAADVRVGAAGLTWTWAPDGVESMVELTVIEQGDRTTVRVVERRPTAAGTGSGGGAKACLIGNAWDDRLFGLELRWLQRTLIPA